MKAYKTRSGIVIQMSDQFYLLKDQEWDAFINRDDLYNQVLDEIKDVHPAQDGQRLIEEEILPPIESQEVWGAGLTYYQSLETITEEAKQAGGTDYYSLVYTAERPELFYKASPHRVSGHQQPVRIRKDSTWSVPEPELTLCITSSGKIIGYTIGNDMSSHSIAEENPLYTPQAKIYDGCVAIGPAILITETFDFQNTAIHLKVERNQQTIFSGSTTLEKMKRKPEELIDFLYRESSFPAGCLLLTGTGIALERAFTLQPGDRIHISIDEIGTLTNYVE